jgi:hypothetical protein
MALVTGGRWNAACVPGVDPKKQSVAGSAIAVEEKPDATARN